MSSELNKNCLFCRIIRKEIPAKIIYEESNVVVFSDINPKAPVHLLIVPTVHIESFLGISDKQMPSLTKMTKVVQRIIREEKLSGGYQVIFNGGSYQHVPHLHWHLLGD